MRTYYNVPCCMLTLPCLIAALVLFIMAESQKDEQDKLDTYFKTTCVVDALNIKKVWHYTPGAAHERFEYKYSMQIAAMRPQPHTMESPPCKTPWTDREKWDNEYQLNCSSAIGKRLGDWCAFEKTVHPVLKTDSYSKCSKFTDCKISPDMSEIILKPHREARVQSTWTLYACALAFFLVAFLCYCCNFKSLEIDHPCCPENGSVQEDQYDSQGEQSWQKNQALYKDLETKPLIAPKSFIGDLTKNEEPTASEAEGGAGYQNGDPSLHKDEEPAASEAERRAG